MEAVTGIGSTVKECMVGFFNNFPEGDQILTESHATILLFHIADWLHGGKVPMLGAVCSRLFQSIELN